MSREKGGTLRWSPNKFLIFYQFTWASLVVQMVKHLPAMWETWVQSLGWEDPLEKAMATHSSTLAWKIPWMEETGRLQSMGSQRVGHDWATSLTCHQFTWIKDFKISFSFSVGDWVWVKLPYFTKNLMKMDYYLCY